MRVLTAEELVAAEKALKDYFPKSLKVYGHIFSINRCKSHTTEVLVDSWPDFKTIICRSSLKEDVPVNHKPRQRRVVRTSFLGE